MAEKHVHKVYGSFPPWGKSVEFPASGRGDGYHLGDEMELTIPYGVYNTPVTIKYKFGDRWEDYIGSDKNTNGLRIGDDFSIRFDTEGGFYATLTYKGELMNVAPPEMIYPWREYEWSIVG